MSSIIQDGMSYIPSSDNHDRKQQAQEIASGFHIDTPVALTLEDALNFVAAHVRSTGKLQMEAIRDLWGQLRLGPSEIDQLAQEGLQGRLSGILHNRFAGETSVSASITQTTKPEVITVSVSILERECYATSRGTIPLIRFTQQDCAEVHDLLVAQAEGFTRRARVIGLAKTLLHDNEANEVRDLPPDALELLASRWAKV